MLVLSGCTRDFRYQPLGMWNGARLKPMEQSPMPGEAGVAREPVPGTIARGDYAPDDPVTTGREGGKLLARTPIPVTRELVQRGQERFGVYCSPCHGLLGDGQGMLVKRGFPHPPDYALPRLRKAATGHFYDVITYGYGVMYSQAQNVPVKDRWAIAEYIRVLQKQRPVVTVDLWEAERKRARESGIRDPRRTRDPALEREEGSGHGEPAPAPPPASSH